MNPNKITIQKNLRENDALMLRAQGLSYREIAAKLQISKSAVGNYIKKALDALNAQSDQLVEQIRMTEHLRLQMLVKTFLPKAKAGDIDAAHLIVKIIETEARLFNVGSQPVITGNQVIQLVWPDSPLGADTAPPSALPDIIVGVENDGNTITTAA